MGDLIISEMLPNERTREKVRFWECLGESVWISKSIFSRIPSDAEISASARRADVNEMCVEWEEERTFSSSSSPVVSSKELSADKLLEVDKDAVKLFELNKDTVKVFELDTYLEEDEDDEDDDDEGDVDVDVECVDWRRDSRIMSTIGLCDIGE